MLRLSKDSCIIVGLTGSIALYKSCIFVRLLRQLGVSVICVMTDAAQRFVQPLTFETLSGHRVYTGMFQDTMSHIRLVKQVDALVVIPATARYISDFSTGRCSDLLVAISITIQKKIFVVPAMHDQMWKHPTTQNNVQLLEKNGVFFVPPTIGDLVDDHGEGRMREPSEILDIIDAHL